MVPYLVVPLEIHSAHRRVVVMAFLTAQMKESQKGHRLVGLTVPQKVRKTDNLKAHQMVDCLDCCSVQRSVGGWADH